MSRDYNTVAAFRNVQRLESVGTTMALGELSFEDLLTLDTNLQDRLATSHHDWKSEQLERDLGKVANEFYLRLGGEAA